MNNEFYMCYPTGRLLTVILLIILVFTECRTAAGIHADKAEYKSIYIEEFKLTYLRKLLKAAFNNSESISSLIQSDNSGFTEPVLSHLDHKFIDSLVEIDNVQMKTDSANRIGRVAEGAEGKHVFSFVLDKFNGKAIERFAKQRYRLAKISSDYFIPRSSYRRNK